VPVSDPYEIMPIPPDRWATINAVFSPPGSKSMTNRALLLAALAEGRTKVRGALRGADDTERMLAAIASLGAGVRAEPGSTTLVIDGIGGRWRVGPAGARLDLNNAGTATRFLAASALLADGPITIDGNKRMRQRPIGQLADAIEQLGGRVAYLEDAGCPPVRIEPPMLGAFGSSVRLGTTSSGQFISALLLAAPWMPGGLTLELDNDPTSASYVRMTLAMLAGYGIDIDASDDLRRLRVEPGPVRTAEQIEIEPDASSATYWWAAGAILPGARCSVRGIGPGSLQGDAVLPDVLAQMGVETGAEAGSLPSVWTRGPDRLEPVRVDCREMPDAAVTLAVVCALAHGPSEIRGVRTLRIKECDRIAALKAELGRLDVEVKDSPNGDTDVMRIVPPAGGVPTDVGAAPLVFRTYEDHRMAMALSLIGLRRPGVRIADPGCVGKTYPGYWDDLAMLTG